MSSKEIVDILYEFHARADIKLEELAEFIEDKIPDIVLCLDCKWWNPRGKITNVSVPFSGECKFMNRKIETSCGEFCCWGERKDDPSHPFADDVMMGERKDDV